MDIKRKQFLNNNILRFLQYLISMVYDLVYQKNHIFLLNNAYILLKYFNKCVYSSEKKNKTNRT